MTKHEIVIMIISIVLSLLSTSLWNKIVEPYIPERKKLISYIKKFLLLILQYALPIGSLIYLLRKAPDFDNLVVVFIVLNVGLVLFNVFMSFYVKVLNNLIEVNKDILSLYLFVLKAGKENIEIHQQSTDIIERIGKRLAKKKGKKK